MASNPDPKVADIVHLIRAFIMASIEGDALKLRSGAPRIRRPLTPLAEKIFRTLLFTFENVITGLCMPSIAVIADQSGGSKTQVKVLLKALSRTEYLSWKPGKRKRVLTKKGWRVVHGSNRYRLLCPHRHLDALRRRLIQAFGGKCGSLIQKLIARYTPPTEQEKAVAEIVGSLAASWRPGAAGTASTQPETPPPRPPPTSGEPVVVGGVTIPDPELGGVLSRLWEAIQKRDQDKP